MNCKTVTSMLCDDNPFVDYFKPLMYTKDKIQTITMGYNSDMICPGKSTFDVQSYDPRTCRWCLLMFLVEAFEITEKHVRSQCYIDEEDFPDLDLVPYMRFCQMLGWTEINKLLDSYFWGGTNPADPEFIIKNYIPNLSRAFKKNMNMMFKCINDDFEYTIEVMHLPNGRYPNGGMTITIASDIQ